MAFSVGIVALGLPGWWILHRLSYRNWRAAFALGMALTFIGDVAFAVDPLPSPSPAGSREWWSGGPPMSSGGRTRRQGTMARGTTLRASF